MSNVFKERRSDRVSSQILQQVHVSILSGNNCMTDLFHLLQNFLAKCHCTLMCDIWQSWKQFYFEKHMAEVLILKAIMSLDGNQ